MTYEFTEQQLKIASERIISAFGLALRAGKCAVGSEMCVEAIRANKAMLVIMPSDVSDNTRKRITDSASFHGVSLIQLPCTKEYLAKKFGKSNQTTCAAITDSGFVKIIDKLYSEIHTSHTEVQQ